MNSYTVSVIIPCYNAESYLVQTLNSALSQNLIDFHVIAVNDGSTDSTAAILNSYSERITIISHQDLGNHGQAATLNLGLAHTDSKYVAFMDSDDVWHPDKLKKQVEILDKYEDVGLVYTNGHAIDGDDNILYTLFDINHCETNTIGSLLLDCYIRTPSLVMVRRSLIQATGPFAEGLIASDHDMWIRAHERSKFYYLNEMLTCYRQHSNQISVNSAKKMWENGFLILNEAMQRHPYPASIRRKRGAVIHYRLGKFAIHAKRYLTAIYHFLMAFLKDPFRAIINLKRVLQRPN